MSEDREESDQGHGQQHVLKRKRPRACDQCRRRKVKCDGSEAAGTTCSTCTSFGDECTYSQSKRSHRDEEYVKYLESEVTRLRWQVQELQVKLEEKEKSSSRSTPSVSDFPRSHSSPSLSVKQEDTDEDTLLDRFKYMNLSEAKHARLIGRSSHFPLVKAALRLKHDLVKGGEGGQIAVEEELDDFVHRRPQFWTYLPDYIVPDPPYTDFPEPALMDELLEFYFRNIHVHFPLLHRPNLLQSIASGLHLVDEGFGAVVLLVCALSARFSQNPATLPTGATTWQLAGWSWFDQVRSKRTFVPLAATTLYDVQVAVLTAVYAATLALPHTNYLVVGLGFRLAQNLGAHRRITYSATPTIESEQCKRAFWCLIVLDRVMCTVLGRPCSIQDEDYDLDYPIECDDEYWTNDDPRKAFQQPPGKPSFVTHFNCYLKLTQIHSRALRSVYSLQSSRELQDPERAQLIVAELDSELNEWFDSLPEHLRYDPLREDMPFASQATSLNAAYHTLRIFIHRPFITMPRTVPLPFPSLTICTNAARSCIQVVERYFALSGPILVFQNHFGSLFSATLVLILNLWQGKHSGKVIDEVAEFKYIHTALHVLKSLELHWDVAGRFGDILRDLMNAFEPARRETGPPPINQTTLYTNTQHSWSETGTTFAEQPTQAMFSALPSQLPDIFHDTLMTGGSAPPIVSQDPTAPFPLFSAAEPDFEAIFADLLPAPPYDGVVAGQQYALCVGGSPLTQAHLGKSQGYGVGCIPGWSAGVPGGS